MRGRGYTHDLTQGTLWKRQRFETLRSQRSEPSPATDKEKEKDFLFLQLSVPPT